MAGDDWHDFGIGALVGHLGSTEAKPQPQRTRCQRVGLPSSLGVLGGVGEATEAFGLVPFHRPRLQLAQRSLGEVGSSIINRSSSSCS